MIIHAMHEAVNEANGTLPERKGVKRTKSKSKAKKGAQRRRKWNLLDIFLYQFKVLPFKFQQVFAPQWRKDLSKYFFLYVLLVILVFCVCSINNFIQIVLTSSDIYTLELALSKDFIKIVIILIHADFCGVDFRYIFTIIAEAFCLVEEEPFSDWWLSCMLTFCNQYFIFWCECGLALSVWYLVC